MKKLILMVGMLMLAVAVMAVGKVSYSDGINELNRLLTVEKNMVTAQAYLDNMDMAQDDNTKQRYVTAQMQIDKANGISQSSAIEVKSYIAGIATKIGLTDQQKIDFCTMSQLYYTKFAGNWQAVVDYYKTMTNPVKNATSLAGSATVRLGNNKDAIPLFVAGENYYAASVSAQAIKDKVLTFEYSRKAILDSGFLSANLLTNTLDRVNSFDYAGTSVTPAMLLDLAVATNRKYSNFLVKDKATWEPVITGLRTTIEEMKKDVVK
jgi:hypothetical protein